MGRPPVHRVRAWGTWDGTMGHQVKQQQQQQANGTTGKGRGSPIWPMETMTQ